MTKAKFLVVYCLFISGLCCMANVTKDINMRFKDVRQGLSHQTVNCFYQDEFGFLWIGTQDGLNRFDGRKFEVFKPDNANPYSSISIISGRFAEIKPDCSLSVVCRA